MTTIDQHSIIRRALDAPDTWRRKVSVRRIAARTRSAFRTWYAGGEL